ncbi:hypothetical protein MKW98_020241 [Papaver atlanticum]|uniref:Bromodomain containing protein n=1 Tax=Papaver atlanticum TaxID=357466 RepID=A0AAD4S9C5_9MAGN|nr:hypothetical protein MKW98_020241 [Papaver atlanticum]
MLTLRSSDGWSFEVDEAIALQSQTIKRMSEDNYADNWIPLPNKHVADIPQGDDGKVEDPELQNWDAEFLKVDQDTLLDLILAANYLNIKHLLNLTCQTIADRKRSNHWKFHNKKCVSTASTSTSELMKQCKQLLNLLRRHKYAYVFNTPVDTVRLRIPDYFTYIKHPMDLGTVKSKIANGEYSSPLGFRDDVRLTFSNAMTYNLPGNNVHTMASIEKQLPGYESVPVPLQLNAARDTVAAKSIPPSKRMQISSPGHERKMTKMEKLKLHEDLLESIIDLPSYLIEFLRNQSTSQIANDADEELEIDLENMTDDTLFTLRKLVDDCMQRKAINPCSTEYLIPLYLRPEFL